MTAEILYRTMLTSHSPACFSLEIFRGYLNLNVKKVANNIN